MRPSVGPGKHTECDIPRARREEAVALQEADVSLLGQVPIGPASSTNYEASVPFDLYGTLALTSLLDALLDLSLEKAEGNENIRRKRVYEVLALSQELVAYLDLSTQSP